MFIFQKISKVKVDINKYSQRMSSNSTVNLVMFVAYQILKNKAQTRATYLDLLRKFLNIKNLKK